MKNLIITLSLLFSFNYAWGQTTMPTDAIDLTSGALYLKSSGYAVGATGNTVTTHTGEYNIYTSASTSNYITAEAGPQTVNIWNVNFLTSSGSGFISNSTSNNLTVNCYGDNYMTNSVVGSASFFKFKSTTTVPTFTLSGDKLTTANYNNPFATITYYNFNIILNIKYLNITCTSPSIGYAIGGNPNSIIPSITINDSNVLTVNNGYIGPTKAITVGKASIKFNGGSFATTPVNSNGDVLYCVTVPRNGTHTIAVKNNTTGTSTDYTFTYEHPNDDNYYLWLPNGRYTLTSNETDYSATVNGAAVTATLETKVGDGSIDVSKGIITIYDGGYQIASQPYSYTGKVFTLSGTTTANTVTITGGADTVKLNGVDMEPTAGCALNINSGTDLTVVLNEGTTNTLISALSYAGLQKSQTSGMLTIKGTGTLVAHSATGSNTSNNAAGIGSASGASCANITIEGGNITASAYRYVGAIGAGKGGSTSNIFIKGGNLTLSTGIDACPIGEYGSSASGIVISGGRIVLTSGEINKGEAPYLLPNNVTITGGTVYGKTIGLGKLYASMGTGCVITGGSVNMVDTAGAVVLASDGHPTNGTTTDYLYRSLFLVPGITTATAINAITVDGTSWGCNDIYTNDTGLVYLWLPKDDASAYETTTVTITVGDKTYTYVGQIDAIDNIIEGTSSISAQGNLFYQVPISITENNATLTVTDYDGNAIINGSLICTGQLDDNKPRLTISASPADGYTDATFTYTNLEKGSKYYEVTAGINDTVKIVSSATVQTSTMVGKTSNEGITAYASDNNIVIKAAAGNTVTIYTLTGQKIISDVTTSTTETYGISTPGVYIVKLSDKRTCKTVKCVVK
jgi:hypothetical protein